LVPAVNVRAVKVVIVLALAIVALKIPAESAQRNRPSLEHMPPCAVSLHAGARVVEGVEAGVLWEVEFNPVLPA
jgi:hypothetical protein